MLVRWMSVRASAELQQARRAMARIGLIRFTRVLTVELSELPLQQQPPRQNNDRDTAVHHCPLPPRSAQVVRGLREVVLDGKLARGGPPHEIAPTQGHDNIDPHDHAQSDATR